MTSRLVSTTRFLLIVLLCWIAATLLVFSRLDERIDMSHHNSYSQLQELLKYPPNRKSLIKRYSRRSEAVHEMENLLEDALNKSNKILQEANRTLALILDKNPELFKDDNDKDKRVSDLWRNIRNMAVLKTNKQLLKMQRKTNTKDNNQNRISVQSDISSNSEAKKTISKVDIRPDIPDANEGDRNNDAHNAGSKVKSEDNLEDKNSLKESKEEYSQYNADNNVVKPDVPDATDVKQNNTIHGIKSVRASDKEKVSMKEKKLVDSADDSPNQNNNRESRDSRIGRQEIAGPIKFNPVNVSGDIDQQREYVDADETYFQEGKDPIPVLPEAVYDRMGPGAPGEQGLVVKLNYNDLSAEEKVDYDEGEKKHQFTEYVSKKISLHRSLRDVRHAHCPRQYGELPATSVIICFHNEAWTVLLRSVHSVLDRSPEHLITEVILVDDFSDMDHLKGPLEYYLRDYKKVRILRTRRREGLIRARLIGVAAARGPVLTFLDSHIECFDGWLEPLLDRVKTAKSIIVCPVINSINRVRFSVDGSPATSIGKFDIESMQFNWMPVPRSETERRTSEADPIRTPTIAGGLFSISKDYFNHIGRYDEGMEIWGFENVEISLRVWMCGGIMEIHPCSHVGHIFRSVSPYNWTKSVSTILRKNSVRVAEVWLDDYKDRYYQAIGYQLGDYGNVSDRKRLRRELGCKSFQWYIDNVYPSIVIPPKMLFVGEIKAKGRADQCLDSMGGKLPAIQFCHGAKGNQLWFYSDVDTLGVRGFCLTVRPGSQLVKFVTCKTASETNKWIKQSDGRIQHESTGLCLQRADTQTGRGALTLAECSIVDAQLWNFVPSR